MKCRDTTSLLHDKVNVEGMILVVLVFLYNISTDTRVQAWIVRSDKCASAVQKNRRPRCVGREKDESSLSTPSVWHTAHFKYIVCGNNACRTRLVEVLCRRNTNAMKSRLQCVRQTRYMNRLNEKEQIYICIMRYWCCECNYIECYYIKLITYEIYCILLYEAELNIIQKLVYLIESRSPIVSFISSFFVVYHTNSSLLLSQLSQFDRNTRIFASASSRTPHWYHYHYHAGSPTSAGADVQ